MRSTRRPALIVFAGVPAVLAGLGLVTTSPGGFAYGFWIGLLGTALALALCWLWSLGFESKHLNESASFWSSQEAKVRPRVFFACVVVACLGVVSLIVAMASTSASLAGVSLAPTFVAASGVLLMWGKVP
jgi:hypothetical protein